MITYLLLLIASALILGRVKTFTYFVIYPAFLVIALFVGYLLLLASIFVYTSAGWHGLVATIVAIFSARSLIRGTFTQDFKNFMSKE